jgi:hypothetical protein
MKRAQDVVIGLIASWIKALSEAPLQAAAAPETSPT